ncbi:MAG: hypothetical protein CVV64_04515 [Candidatus Wallbacteria bacterium HGW-Wallbacteria-1]|jgi:HEAT repeat protein|uniref:HEAT repeat domain-containing protein n=1 Tax=Candidatus Wallbacteria bacterium HGW-Wallbacteria-1 TaxID=2013854 RepID=A0A2N1PRS5_9BACT|nr:MAG: hypothetical protein CVV64_04515 [Candidatus Wallbacteria bacterium HGW-Wallbacteria-1]
MARDERDDLDLEGACSLLKSKRLDDRKKAVAALRQMGGTQAVVALLDCFEDSFWPVRERASNALVGLAAQSSQHLLKQSQRQDLSQDRAYWLLKTMAVIGPSMTKGILKIASTDQDDIRGYAFRIIGLHQIREGVQLLARGLGDKEWKNRKQASEALISFGTPVYGSLQKLLMESIRNPEKIDFSYWCARTLGKLWPEGIVEAYTPYSRDKDWLLRLNSIVAIGAGGHPKGIPVLAASLFDAVPQIRDHAQRFLRHHGAAAANHLSALYSKANGQQRILLSVSMGSILGAAGVEAGKRMFASREQAVRMDGLTVLGETRHPDAVMPLMSAFRDPCWQVRDHASAMIARIGSSSYDQLSRGLATKYSDIRYWTVITLGRLGGRREIETLAQHSQKDDPVIQSAIISALEEMYGPEAHEIAVRMLDGSTWSIRSRACGYLVSKGPQVIPKLMTVFDGGTENATYWAMKVFIGLGDKAVEALEEILNSPKSELRSQAYLSLGMIASRNSMKAIIEAFRKGDETLCYFIIKALASADSEDMVRYLVEIMPSCDSSINRWISLLLQRVGKSGLEMLLQGLGKASTSEIAYWYLKALKNTDEPSVLAAVLPFLDDRNPQVRLETLEVISEIADSSCTSRLIRLLDDPNQEIRRAVIPVIASTGDPESIAPILKFLVSSDEETATRILDHFGRSFSAPFLESLVSIMEKTSEEEPLVIPAGTLLAAMCSDEEILENVESRVVGSSSILAGNLVRILREGDFEISFQKWKALFEANTDDSVRQQLAFPIAAFLFCADTGGREAATRYLTDTLTVMVPYLIGVCEITSDPMMKLTLTQFIESLGERAINSLEQVIADEKRNSKLASQLLEAIRVACH